MDEDDASIVKGMIARGDRQHDIAAWFGVNGGRIAEIASGQTFANIPATARGLPPPGPYTSGRSVEKARNELEAVKDALRELIDRVDEQIENLK